jgi:hypothetical protein
MTTSFYDENSIDVLISILTLCTVTSLCRLSQTCHFLRKLILEKRNEFCTARLNFLKDDKENFWKLLRVFGGLPLLEAASLMNLVVDINKPMILRAQSGMVENLVKNNKIVLDENCYGALQNIICLQVQLQAVKLIEYFWDKGVYPFEDKTKECHFYETTERLFFDTVVGMQCILTVFSYQFSESQVVAWLKEKVDIPPSLTCFCHFEFQN